MKVTKIFASLCVLSALGAWAQTPEADHVMAEAKRKAAAEHKAIYVHFGASWCGWCKRLDAFLAEPGIKPVFERYFVPVKLVVSESEPNRKLENAGAKALLDKLGGARGGLPFSAFLDAKGELIVNSNRDGNQNIGYPYQPEEIAHFVAMMKKAAPKMSGDDVKTIENWLKEHGKKS